MRSSSFVMLRGVVSLELREGMTPDAVGGVRIGTGKDLKRFLMEGQD